MGPARGGPTGVEEAAEGPLIKLLKEERVRPRAVSERRRSPKRPARSRRSPLLLLRSPSPLHSSRLSASALSTPTRQPTLPSLLSKPGPSSRSSGGRTPSGGEARSEGGSASSPSTTSSRCPVRPRTSSGASGRTRTRFLARLQSLTNCSRSFGAWTWPGTAASRTMSRSCTPAVWDCRQDWAHSFPSMRATRVRFISTLGQTVRETDRLSSLLTAQPISRPSQTSFRKQPTATKL